MVLAQQYTQNDILIVFFNHIYNIINKQFNNHSIKAVITVPSNFNDTQREIIKNTFQCVDIEVIRIINEPSACCS
jgi:molecular chaperone DnaK (HSP70)